MLRCVYRAAIFKAKAMAEKEKYQAQGLKAGEDFVDGKSTGLEWMVWC